MKYLILVILSVWLFSSCKNGKISFERIDINCYINTYPHKEGDSYSESYIVDNYTGSKANEAKMDSFACQLITRDTIDYKRHWIYFYKRSRKTNIPYIEKHHDDWFVYTLDHDFIVNYEFMESEFKLKTFGNKPIIRFVGSDEFSCD